MRKRSRRKREGDNECLKAWKNHLYLSFSPLPFRRSSILTNSSLIPQIPQRTQHLFLLHFSPVYKICKWCFFSYKNWKLSQRVRNEKLNGFYLRHNKNNGYLKNNKKKLSLFQAIKRQTPTKNRKYVEYFVQNKRYNIKKNKQKIGS